MHEFGDGYKAIAPSREMLPMDPGSERAIVSTLIDKFTRRVHPRDFVLVTHSAAPERFWVQVVKHKDGIIWGIVDNSLIFVDWPQGKKIRFSICRVFDVYAGEA